MKWTTVKARVTVGRLFVCTVEQVEGAHPWRWRVVRIRGDGWPLFGGFCNTEDRAKRVAIEHAQKELRILQGKVELLDKVEREWLELFAPAAAGIGE